MPKPTPDTSPGDELDEIFNASPIDKEVPEDVWKTIYPTWTGLWTDAYGEWDERQPSDIYPLTELLSTEAEARLKDRLNRLMLTRAKSFVPKFSDMHVANAEQMEGYRQACLDMEAAIDAQLNKEET